MNAETTELARELVALGEPWFRWMPGMCVIVNGDDDGAIITFVMGQDKEMHVVSHADDCIWVNKSRCIPDLEDPATAGCLQHILDGLDCDYGTGPTFGTRGRRYCVGPSRSFDTRGQAIAAYIKRLAKEASHEAE